jgi:hypothetical protein
METHQLQCTLVFDLMVSAAKSVSCGKQITKHYVSDTMSAIQSPIVVIVWCWTYEF